jgi:hypothetical protein
MERSGYKVCKRIVAVVLLLTGVLAFAIQAEFYPERIYKERKKTSLDFGWKFYPGTPSGTPSDSSFNDNGWYSVNVPHSASYDVPTPEGQAAGFSGVCWYRKIFTVPQANHTGKIFIEFEGAMQVADVWLNGKKLGTHDNSGFTWFSFDVSSAVSRSGQNVIAVRLDNRYNLNVPPGDDATTGFPDYYLFSGLYRDVWLVCTDQCYIPLYGQQISIPVAQASAASAVVRIKTKVTSATAGSVMVRYIIANPSNNGILADSITKTVAANQTVVFDKTTGPVQSPSLWSPQTPNLYTLYTQVFKDGSLVDDYADRFGVRWYTWTPEDGFALNGTITILKGASLHQSIGWIESALPKSRFFKEVGMVRDMGANLIRCAHFPRDPSFYNACDELGMLVMVEVPTWGTSTQAYSDSFWVRLNNCMREMIEVGQNHPSIIAWGLFNEPHLAYNAANQIPLCAATAHTMDSTRYTYLADNRNNDPALLAETDIEGVNYGELGGPCWTLKARLLNTEYHEGWMYWCFRGGQNDNESPSGYAQQRWNLWTNLFSVTRTNKLAGACMWSFNDYWSPFIQKPMGVVDHYRIPKAVYYYFRKQWTGVASETPVLGLTPTKLKLNSDLDSLIADSTDVAIVTASFRDASNTCVDTKSGPGDSIPVTFTVTGPANYFGPLTVKANAGKCALIIKSKNTPGTITVSATAPNLPAAEAVTIKSVFPDTTPLPFLTNTPVIMRGKTVFSRDIAIRQYKNLLQVSLPGKSTISKEVYLFDTRGRVMACPVSDNRGQVIIDTKKLARGYYCLTVGKRHGTDSFMKKILIDR